MSLASAGACLRRLLEDPAFMAEVSGAADAGARREIIVSVGHDSTHEGEGHCGFTHEAEATIFGGSTGCGLTHETE